MAWFSETKDPRPVSIDIRDHEPAISARRSVLTLFARKTTEFTHKRRRYCERCLHFVSYIGAGWDGILGTLEALKLLRGFGMGIRACPVLLIPLRDLMRNIKK